MNNNKTLYIAIAVVAVVLIGAGVWMWSSVTPTVQAPVGPGGEEQPTASLQVPEPDSTGAIDQELQAVDVGGLDKEFSDVDKDLGNL